MFVSIWFMLFILPRDQLQPLCLLTVKYVYIFKLSMVADGLKIATCVVFFSFPRRQDVNIDELPRAEALTVR